MKKSESEWQNFLKLCLEAKNPKMLHELLQLFLAPEEIEMLAKRFAIIKALLKRELTQREMAETLSVSIAQITRGSNALKITDAALLFFLKKKI